MTCYLTIKDLYHGYFATRVNLPLSGLARRWQRYSKKKRGKSDQFLQQTRLPEISWRVCTQRRAFKIREPDKENGNIRIGELGVLAALAAACRDGTSLFEIGTFDGRTTLNLALNSPAQCPVYTLDLPPGLETSFPLAEGERHMIDKPKPGVRYEKYRSTDPAVVEKIRQLLGDSATFDFSPFRGSCSLVFVDGSHAYDYVVSDTRAALDMVSQDGVIIWHDYGIWEGVTRALEELDRQEGYGLLNIKHTSLVYWKKT